MKTKLQKSLKGILAVMLVVVLLAGTTITGFAKVVDTAETGGFTHNGYWACYMPLEWDLDNGYTQFYWTNGNTMTFYTMKVNGKLKRGTNPTSDPTFNSRKVSVWDNSQGNIESYGFVHTSDAYGNRTADKATLDWTSYNGGTYSSVTDFLGGTADYYINSDTPMTGHCTMHMDEWPADLKVDDAVVIPKNDANNWNRKIYTQTQDENGNWVKRRSTALPNVANISASAYTYGYQDINSTIPSISVAAGQTWEDNGFGISPGVFVKLHCDSTATVDAPFAGWYMTKDNVNYTRISKERDCSVYVNEMDPSTGKAYPYTYVARFGESEPDETYNVGVQASIGGDVSVSSVESDGVHATDEITAIPDTSNGYAFVEWALPDSIQLASGYSITDSTIKLGTVLEDGQIIYARFQKAVSWTAGVKEGTGADDPTDKGTVSPTSGDGLLSTVAWPGVIMKEESQTIYCAEIPTEYRQVIFVRLNSAATDFSWDYKYNQTADLTVANDKDQYCITGWGPSGGNSDGNWDVYGGTIPAATGGDLNYRTLYLDPGCWKTGDSNEKFGIYAFDSSSGSAPVGIIMSKMYKAVIPESSTGIIFNSGSNQTVDIENLNHGHVYWVNGSDASGKATVAHAPYVKSEPSSPSFKTVYFLLPNGWDDLKIYYWQEDEQGNNIYSAPVTITATPDDDSEKDYMLDPDTSHYELTDVTNVSVSGNDITFTPTSNNADIKVAFIEDTSKYRYTAIADFDTVNHKQSGYIKIDESTLDTEKTGKQTKGQNTTITVSPASGFIFDSNSTVTISGGQIIENGIDYVNNTITFVNNNDSDTVELHVLFTKTESAAVSGYVYLQKPDNWPTNGMNLFVIGNDENLFIVNDTNNATIYYNGSPVLEAVCSVNNTKLLGAFAKGSDRSGRDCFENVTYYGFVNIDMSAHAEYRDNRHFYDQFNLDRLGAGVNNTSSVIAKLYEVSQACAMLYGDNFVAMDGDLAFGQGGNYITEVIKPDGLKDPQPKVYDNLARAKGNSNVNNAHNALCAVPTVSIEDQDGNAMNAPCNLQVTGFIHNGGAYQFGYGSWFMAKDTRTFQETYNNRLGNVWYSSALKFTITWMKDGYTFLGWYLDDEEEPFSTEFNPGGESATKAYTYYYHDNPEVDLIYGDNPDPTQNGMKAHTFHARFTQSTCTLHAQVDSSCSSLGTVSPATIYTSENVDSVEIVATPTSGTDAMFTHWVLPAGVSLSTSINPDTGEAYQLTDRKIKVRIDHGVTSGTLTAFFVPSYAWSTTCDTLGSLDSTSGSIKQGDPVEVIATALPGYVINTESGNEDYPYWTYVTDALGQIVPNGVTIVPDGQDGNGGNKYKLSFTPTADSWVLHVGFKDDPTLFTWSAVVAGEGHGTVSQSTGAGTRNQNQTVIYTPDSGYEIDPSSIIVTDGTLVSYQVNDETGQCTVTFTSDKFTGCQVSARFKMLSGMIMVGVEAQYTNNGTTFETTDNASEPGYTNIASVGSTTGRQVAVPVFTDGVSVIAAESDKYHFLGWYNSDDELLTDQLTYEVPSADIMGNVTYTAKYAKYVSVIYQYASVNGYNKSRHTALGIHPISSFGFWRNNERVEYTGTHTNTDGQPGDYWKYEGHYVGERIQILLESTVWRRVTAIEINGKPIDEYGNFINDDDTPLPNPENYPKNDARNPDQIKKACRIVKNYNTDVPADRYDWRHSYAEYTITGDTTVQPIGILCYQSRVCEFTNYNSQTWRPDRLGGHGKVTISSEVEHTVMAAIDERLLFTAEEQGDYEFVGWFKITDFPSLKVWNESNELIFDDNFPTGNVDKQTNQNSFRVTCTYAGGMTGYDGVKDADHKIKLVTTSKQIWVPAGDYLVYYPLFVKKVYMAGGTNATGDNYATGTAYEDTKMTYDYINNVYYKTVNVSDGSSTDDYFAIRGKGYKDANTLLTIKDPDHIYNSIDGEYCTKGGTALSYNTIENDTYGPLCKIYNMDVQDTKPQGDDKTYTDPTKITLKRLTPNELFQETDEEGPFRFEDMNDQNPVEEGHAKYSDVDYTGIQADHVKNNIDVRVHQVNEPNHHAGDEPGDKIMSYPGELEDNDNYKTFVKEQGDSVEITLVYGHANAVFKPDTSYVIVGGQKNADGSIVNGTWYGRFSLTDCEDPDAPPAVKAWNVQYNERTRVLTFDIPKGFSFPEDQNWLTIEPDVMDAHKVSAAIVKDDFLDIQDDIVDFVITDTTPSPNENIPNNGVSPCHHNLDFTFTYNNGYEGEYVFEGWYSDKATTKLLTKDPTYTLTNITNDTYVYACFSRKLYLQAWKPDGTPVFDSNDLPAMKYNAESKRYYYEGLEYFGDGWQFKYYDQNHVNDVDGASAFDIYGKDNSGLNQGIDEYHMDNTNNRFTVTGLEAGVSGPMDVYYDLEQRILDQGERKPSIYAVSTPVGSHVYLSGGINQTNGSQENNKFSNSRYIDYPTPETSQDVITVDGITVYPQERIRAKDGNSSIIREVITPMIQNESQDVRVATTITEAYKSLYYVDCFVYYCTETKTLRSVPATGNNLTGEYTATIPLAGKGTCYICPIFVKNSAKKYVYFDFDEISPYADWGPLVSMYTHEGATSGYFPGQLMIPSSDGKTFYMIVEESYGTNVTFTNYLNASPFKFDKTINGQSQTDSDHYLNLSTREFEQTYDYQEFSVILSYDEIGGEKVDGCIFKMKKNDDDYHGDSLDGGVRGESRTDISVTNPDGSPKQHINLSDYSFRYLKRNDGVTHRSFKGTPTTKSVGYYVVSAGDVSYLTHKSNPIGEHAVKWYIYDTEGNYITDVFSKDLFEDEFKDDVDSYENNIIKALADADIEYRDESIVISYERENMARDNYLSYDGQWYDISLVNEINVEMQTAFMDDDGVIWQDYETNPSHSTKESNVKVEYDGYSSSTSISSLQAWTGSVTDDGTAFTDEGNPSNGLMCLGNHEIRVSATPDMSGLHNDEHNKFAFVGYYVKDGNKIGECISTDRDAKLSSIVDVTYVAVFRKAKYGIIEYQYYDRFNSKNGSKQELSIYTYEYELDINESTGHIGGLVENGTYLGNGGFAGIPTYKIIHDNKDGTYSYLDEPTKSGNDIDPVILHAPKVGIFDKNTQWTRDNTTISLDNLDNPTKVICKAVQSKRDDYKIKLFTVEAGVSKQFGKIEVGENGTVVSAETPDSNADGAFSYWSTDPEGKVVLTTTKSCEAVLSYMNDDPEQSEGQRAYDLYAIYGRPISSKLTWDRPVVQTSVNSRELTDQKDQVQTDIFGLYTNSQGKSISQYISEGNVVKYGVVYVMNVGGSYNYMPAGDMKYPSSSNNINTFLSPTSAQGYISLMANAVWGTYTDTKGKTYSFDSVANVKNGNWRFLAFGFDEEHPAGTDTLTSYNRLDAANGWSYKSYDPSEAVVGVKDLTYSVYMYLGIDTNGNGVVDRNEITFSKAYDNYFFCKGIE